MFHLLRFPGRGFLRSVLYLFFAWKNAQAKVSVPGDFFVGMLITYSISLIYREVFRCFISPCVSLVRCVPLDYMVSSKLSNSGHLGGSLN